MREVIFCQKIEVVLYVLIARVCIIQTPGRHGHHKLVAADAAGIVHMRVKNLVVHIIGEAIWVAAHIDPEIPDDMQVVVECTGLVRIIPGDDVSAFIGLNRVVDQYFILLGEGGVNQQRQRKCNYRFFHGG